MFEVDKPLIDGMLLRKWIAEYKGLWQLNFLAEGEFSRFAYERDVSLLQGNWPIKLLWQLGLVKADIVVGNDNLSSEYFDVIRISSNGKSYFDYKAPVDYSASGLIDAGKQLPTKTETVELFFHPFRYLVVSWLSQRLTVGPHPLQPISNKDSIHKMLDVSLEYFESQENQFKLLQDLERLNTITDFIVALEPQVAISIFGNTLRYPSLEVTADEQLKRIESHWQRVTSIVKSHTIEELEKIRRDICIVAEWVDPNKRLHTLIRLTNADFRWKLKGAIGGSMLLLTMAEMLRRSIEEVFSIELQEEDQAGFGYFPDKNKADYYGTHRILDGSRLALREFLSILGLEKGLVLRWYVEGDTEEGALRLVFGEYSGVEIVNVSGRVVEKNVVAFRDNLRNDKSSNVFSFITIDGDREDNVRVIKEAAKQEEFCGMFFLQDCDFEFENFEITELGEILWGLAKRNDSDDEKKPEFLSSIENATSSNELWKLAKKALPELIQESKGKKWGRALMEFALDHPYLPNNGEQRQVIESVESAMRAVNYVQFRPNCDRFRVDPETGRMIPRGEN